MRKQKNKGTRRIGLSARILSVVLSLCLIVSMFPCEPVFAASNEQIIFDYFHNTMGLNEAAASGVLANIYCESGFNPNATGDSGTSYGICQWHNSRWDSLKSYCNKNGYNWTTLTGQLHYLEYELTNSYPGVYSTLKNASNDENGAYDAAYKWCYSFEIPANYPSVSVTRGNLAKSTYWPKYKPSNVSVQATSNNYNVSAAVAYADAHWNDGVGLCAEFVCKCLNAGGITGIPNYSYYSSSDLSYCGRPYGVYTNPYTCSAPLLKWLSTKYTVIKSPSYSDMELGDVVFMNNASGNPDGHVGIITGFSGSTPLYSAHNNDRHNSSIGNQATYVVKMNRPNYSGVTPSMPQANASSISCADGDSIVFYWDAVQSADAYWVHIYDEYGSDFVSESIGLNTTCQYRFPKGHYSVAIVAYNSAGESSPCWINITSYGSIPQCPCVTASSTSCASGNSVTFYWDAVPNAESYWVHIYDEYGKDFINQSVGDNTTCVFSFPEGKYSVAVVALNPMGGSDACWTNITSYGRAPETPKVTASSNTCLKNKDITFSWDTVQNADTYWIHIYDEAGRDYVNESVGTKTTYNCTFAKGKYSIAVVAVNPVGESEACWTTVYALEYSVKTTPTISSSGQIEGKYSQNDSVISITLPKLNSTDYNYSIIKKSSCATAGTGRYTWKTTTYGSFYFDVPIAKTSHSYKDVVTAPTCTAQGYTTHTCAVCGDTYKDSTTNALGHSYAYKATTAPTTSATGILTGTCSRCKGTTTVTLPKLNTTDYSYSVTKAATCTTTGTGRYTWKTTTYGSFYFDVTIGKTAHTYKDRVTAPSCTEKGYTTHTCTVCGDSYADTQKAALGHDWNAGVVTKEATEKTDGIRTYTCKRCSATKTEAIPAVAHVHDYRTAVTPPTCTEQGYTTHTCACGDSYKDSDTAALGHSYGSWKSEHAATCTTAGKEFRTCSRCQNRDTHTIEALGHIESEWITDSKPTCTASGTKHTECTRCGSLIQMGTTPATGHQESSWIIDKNASCTASGSKHTECTLCGASIQNAAITALGHDFVVTVVEPTCTERGYTKTVCSRCGDSSIDHYVAALDHSWSQGVVTKEPTETTEGIRSYTCTCCNVVRTEAIPPIIHTHSFVEAVVLPTCTAQGYTIFSCECGYSYIDHYTDALGHEWNDGTITLQPTETQSGVRTYICSRCSEIKTDLIPPTAHTHKYVAQTTVPTCTEAGFTTYICDCGDSYTTDLTAPLGHSFTDGVCTRCGYKETPTAPHEEICPSKQFSDSPTYGNWAHEGIDYCIEHELMNGVGNGLFNPNGTVTRAQLVTILYRVASQPKVTTVGTFADVPAGKWYSDAIEWAAANSIVNGVGDRRFDPMGNITREQIATILYRYEGSPKVNGTLAGFPDSGSVHSYAENALIWATGEGLINGIKSNNVTNLAPQNNATRAQIASIIMRYCAILKIE